MRLHHLVGPMVLLLAGCTTHHRQPMGVLVAHNGPVLLTAVPKACSVWRTGEIEAIKGSFRVSNVRNIALLECASDSEALLANLSQQLSSSGGGFWVAGSFNRRQSVWDKPADAEGRGYVIKLSYANGATSLQSRETDEDNIDAMAIERRNGWRREARLYVDSSAEIETPDAVGVLFFHSPDAREQFRQEHSDMLQVIGEFNQQHLSKYAYIYVTAQ